MCSALGFVNESLNRLSFVRRNELNDAYVDTAENAHPSKLRSIQLRNQDYGGVGTIIPAYFGNPFHNKATSSRLQKRLQS